MQYISTRDKNLKVSFEQAVKRGLAPNKGLFVPEHYITLPKSFWDNLYGMSLQEIGYQVGRQYVGDEIPDADFRALCEDVLSFDIPLVNVKDNIYSLELFHGPTCAFKDVGARFMARCLGYFSRQRNEKTVILVATSGDVTIPMANLLANGSFGSYSAGAGRSISRMQQMPMVRFLSGQAPPAGVSRLDMSARTAAPA
jgi:threonine synthase